MRDRPEPTTVIGLMSGTSYDAIDAAAARLWQEGDTLVLHPLGMLSQPYPAPLREQIAAALPPAATTMETVCRLDTGIGRAFADVAARAAEELTAGQAELIVSHGQTLYHWVDGDTVAGTLQLGQPAWIAERTGTTVVADLRSRDVAAGGQGAPLVSIIDALWLAGRRAAAVNLGGIANATMVDPVQPVLAFDTGPANALIDAAVRAGTGGAQQFDEDGRLAARGTVDQDLLQVLLDEEYYRRPAPKSTGKELFHPGYLDPYLEGRPELALEDLVATLTVLTARTVAAAVREAEEVVLSGGGTRNPALVAALRSELPGTPVRISDELGLPSADKEALAFAVLGFLTMNGQAGTLPSCTGARHGSVLGAIVPGETMPPRTLDRPPQRLRIVTG